MSTITYTVFAEPAETGANWGAWVPDLAVYATAASRDEAIASAIEGARSNLALLAELGRPRPAPSAAADTLTVPA